MEVVLELGFVGVSSQLEDVEAMLELLVERRRLYVNEIDGTRNHLYDNTLGLRPPR